MVNLTMIIDGIPELNCLDMKASKTRIKAHQISLPVRKKIFKKYFLVSCIVAASNVLWVSNPLISYIIIILQLSVLFICYLKNNITEYMAYYALFICNCLGFPELLGSGIGYDLKNVRILGINLGIWILIPVIMKVCTQKIHIGKIKKEHFLFYKISFGLLFMNIIATIIGILLIILNDNGILGMHGIIGSYIKTLYSMAFLPVAFCMGFYYIYMYERKSSVKIALALQAVLFGTVFQQLISLIFGLRGMYSADLSILLESVVSIFIPMLLIIGIDKNNAVYHKISVMAATVGIILELRFTSSGKFILLVGFLIFIGLLHLMKKKNLVVIILIAAIVFILPVLIQKMIVENRLFAAKLGQVMGFVKFWETGWLDKMPKSPKIRIAEILNICIEYLNKPWLFLTGKGYVGSIRDYLHMFGTQSTTLGAFSRLEWENGLFFNMHEIASNFLMFGFMGIVYTGNIIVATIKRYKSNIWIVVGGFWFLVFYGYSFTIGVFGIMALFYGAQSYGKE